jgi:ubiquinone/menaquinone biosynthesis C-methylase UbiE
LDGPEKDVLSTYDRIGADYRQSRKEDPRLARLMARELQAARTVVNVGAGTGSYEPTDRFVVAVEPSDVMLRQRPPMAAPAVQAIAERLPFRDDAFDAAMAVLTVHHWSDQDAGLRELSRVARERIVLLTWDPSNAGFWLMRDYFPEFLEADQERLPPIERLLSLLTDGHVIAVPIPHDCADGFLGAYWRRPEAYLNAEIRRGISSFATCRDLSPLEQLEDHLDTGEWQRRYGELLDKEELDIGYRLVVGRPTRGCT